MRNPIFIIGAGRSGTNVLRDSLTSLPGLITWPCDEINLIFRHGNRGLPHDEFDQTHATPAVKRFIQGEFLKLQQLQPDSTVLEKTCANSLRISFLNAIFPEARFVFIVRNGYDVTSSAMKRWTAPIELRYLKKKFRFVPTADVPYYALQFVKNRAKQFFSAEKRQAQWGPVYREMPADVQHKSLAEVCARQWAESVKQASEKLQKLEEERVFMLRYEEFTKEPLTWMMQLNAWMGRSWTEEEMREAVKDVRQSSVGKGIKSLSDTEKSAIEPLIESTMKQYYDQVPSYR